MIRAIVAACVVALSACASTAPDIVLLNGRIFTSDAEQPWAEALAIRGERIVQVGTNADVAAGAGSATRRVDLGGRTVIPGLIEAHTPLGPMDAAAVRGYAAAAFARGITSMQVFAADRPVAEAAEAFAGAATALRIRLFRMPVPDQSGEHRDSRPHFPPQPTPKLDVRGMGFAFTSADSDRLEQVVRWAYGSEDPLAIRCADADVLNAYLDAMERGGSAEVWRAKRPRVEGPIAISPDNATRLVRLGAVVVQTPGATSSLRSLMDAGVRTALSAGTTSPFAAMQWAVTQAAESERVTPVEAVQLMTRGAAFAEFSEAEKGRIAVGALADLAVLSADVFTVPPDQLPPIQSVMTLIGGQPAHDAGLWGR